MIATERLAPVEFWRRAVILGVVLAVLVLAVVANATMKRHRQAAGSAASAAVAFVHPSEFAESTAWYCPGPLPLGLKHESAFLAIANAATSSVEGQFLVSTSIGLSYSRSISVPARSTLDVAVPSPRHSAFGAASVLVNGSGIGVEELIDSPTGRESAACVAGTGDVQYLAGGSTKGANDIALSLYDPGATPSVANVSFETGSGTVTPLPYQGLPIGAGQVVVVDVGHVVAQQDVVASIVQSSGGHLVVGAIERSAVGNVVFPSLVAANEVPEDDWYLPAIPAGGATTSYIYALNPGSTTATAHVQLNGSGGSALALLTVPAGGVARLTQSPVATSGAMRAASITSSQPILVLESSLLGKALVAPKSSQPPAKSGKAPAKHPSGKGPTTTGAIGKVVSHHGGTVAPGATAPTAAAAAEGLPPVIPIGYALSEASVAANGWLLTGGASDSTLGEFVSIANPGDVASTVTLETLAGGEATEIPAFGAVVIPPASSIVVDLSRVLGSSSQVTVLASSTAPVVVGSGLYAKGSKSVGLSEPVAIPLD